MSYKCLYLLPILIRHQWRLLNYIYKNDITLEVHTIGDMYVLSLTKGGEASFSIDPVTGQSHIKVGQELVKEGEREREMEGEEKEDGCGRMVVITIV